MKQRIFAPRIPLAEFNQGENKAPADGFHATTAGNDLIANQTECTPLQIDTDLIDPSPFQPRTIFNEDEIEALAENIRAIGLMSPIEVRPVEGGRYELIAGERRLLAHRMNGSKVILAFVKELSDEEAIVRVGAENLARIDLAPYEAAKHIKKLRDLGIAQNNTAMSRLTGLSRYEIIRLNAYLDLPPAVLEMLESSPGLIGPTVAKELAVLAIHHPDLVVKAAHKIAGGMHQLKAAAWVRAQLASHPIEEIKKEYISQTGERIGVVAASGKRISITIEHQDRVDCVIKEVQKIMESIAQTDIVESGSDK